MKMTFTSVCISPRDTYTKSKGVIWSITRVELSSMKKREGVNDDSWLALPWTMASNNRRVSDLKKAIMVRPPILSLSLEQTSLLLAWDLLLDRTHFHSSVRISPFHFTAILKFTLNIYDKMQEGIRKLCLTRIWKSFSLQLSQPIHFHFHSEYLFPLLH